jgi:hypothetical protein
MLTEAYLKDIIRPPPTTHLPSNVAHPFQTSFYTYFTKKFLPRHWYLAAGATFTLTLYGTLDSLREAGKKKAYDDAIAAGRPPCERCVAMLIIIMIFFALSRAQLDLVIVCS